jgi:CheY-like chemotaxis protein
VTKRPILVVDDEPDSRDLLVEVLSRGGYSVATAADGAEGLFLARREAPCLILLDLMMAVMDGWTFREMQKRDSAIAMIPVLVVSAHYDGREVAERIGAIGYLNKPFEFNELLSTVQACCEEARVI